MNNFYSAEKKSAAKNKIQKENNMLIKYFKKRNSNIRKGVMVAVPVEELGVISFGYSLCRIRLDEFDKDFGKEIAIDRAAKTLTGRVLSVPHSMRKEFDKFKIRSKKYYKQLKEIEQL